MFCFENIIHPLIELIFSGFAIHACIFLVVFIVVIFAKSPKLNLENFK